MPPKTYTAKPSTTKKKKAPTTTTKKAPASEPAPGDKPRVKKFRKTVAKVILETKKMPTLRDLVSLVKKNESKLTKKDNYKEYLEIKKEYPDENLFQIYKEFLNDDSMDDGRPKPPADTFPAKLKLFNTFTEYAWDTVSTRDI